MTSRRLNTRAFIASDVITQFGAGMVLSSSAWYIFDESSSNSLVALAAGVNTVSGILVSIVAGTLVDRFRPKTIAQGSHVLRILLIAVPLTLFQTFGFHPAFAFVLALNNGLGWNLYFPASKALIQQIAGREGNVGINSAAEVSMQIGLFSSGAVAGLLYGSVGFAPILGASIAAFAVGMAVLALVRVDAPVPAPDEVSQTFGQQFRLGFGFLRARPGVLVLGLVLYSPFVVANVFATVLPGYTVVELVGSAVSYGVIDMMWGVGACIAGIVVLKLSRRLGLTIPVAAALALLTAYGAAMFATRSVGLAIALTTIAGFSAASARILLYSRLMDVVSAGYMGRVVAIVNMASLVLQTAFAQAAGALMDASSPRYGFLLVSGVGLAGLVLFALVTRSDSLHPPLQDDENDLARTSDDLARRVAAQ